MTPSNELLTTFLSTNELLKYGYQLRAGEFVITGNLVTPPVIEPGDSAKIEFTTLGAVELMVSEGEG